MKKLIGCMVLLVGAAGQGLAAEDVQAQLRQRIPLPRVSVSSGLSFSPSQGFHLSSDRVPLADRIARLQKQLVGDESDAERYCQLGSWYDRKGQSERAERAYDRAIALCRAQVKAHPRDMQWLALLGKALDGRGQTAEAEQVLQRAVREDPQRWQGWQALGDVLEQRAYAPIVGQEKWDTGDWQELCEQVRKKPPSAEQTREWQRRYQEARKCYDRAIAVTPTRTQLYVRRAFLAAWHHLVEHQLRSPSPVKKDLLGALFCSESLADLRQAARLTRSDYALIGGTILGEITNYQEAPTAAPAKDAQAGKAATKGILALMPAPLQMRVREHVDRLEEMTRGKDRKLAGGAAECLGILCYMLKDHPDGELWMRRAVALDPSRHRAWELLVGGLAVEDRQADAAELIEKQLAQKDSAHCRFLLAKAHAGLEQWDRAESDVRAGLKLEPDHFLLQLSEAVFLLRKGDAASLTRCGKLLDRLEDRVDEGAKAESRKENYDLVRACHRALTGDEAQARILLILFRDSPQEEAVAQLKARGASVIRDDKLAGKPVVGVSFDETCPRDSDLRRLAVFPHLRELGLHDKKITDQQLVVLKKLTTLTRLRLGGTKITDAGLTHLSDLTRLHSLDLDCTEISGTGLAHLKNLTRLEELDLSCSKVTDEGLDNLRWLPELRHLSLDFTAVTDKGLAHLEHVPQLESLSVSENFELMSGLQGGSHVTDKAMASIGKLKKLRSLSLSSPAIGDKGMAHLRALDRLEELSLPFPSVTDAGLASLEKLERLRRLSLCHTHITDRGLSHLAGLSRLESLNLSSTDVRDAGLAHLVGLQRLRELNLQGTLVTDAGLAHLSKLTSLRELNLSVDPLAWLRPPIRVLSPNEDRPEGPAITSAGARQLARLVELESLDLWGQKLGKEGVAQLQKLPKLRRLGLRKAGLTDASLDSLGKLRQLRQLTLSENPITDAGLKQLQQLSRLTSISLGDTGVSEKGVAQLRKAIPGIEISR